MSLIFVIDLHDTVRVRDIVRVCAPEPWERVYIIIEPHKATLESMAAIAEVFPSATQARKAGFSGLPPHGLELLGTNQRTFWCWNPHGEGPCKLGKRKFKTRQYFYLADSMGWTGG